MKKRQSCDASEDAANIYTAAKIAYVAAGFDFELNPVVVKVANTAWTNLLVKSKVLKEGVSWEGSIE